MCLSSIFEYRASYKSSKIASRPSISYAIGNYLQNNYSETRPRLREFDPQTALTDAMQIFWRIGYTDTSMDDIVTETGVSRYGPFGNKKELLIAAIRNYEPTMTELLGTAHRTIDFGPIIRSY